MQVLFKPAEVEVEVSNQPLGGPTHTQRERGRERINNSTGQGKQGGRVAAFVFARACTTSIYYSPFQHVNLAQVVTRNYVR